MDTRGDLQLAIGYWIVSHRQQLRTWWVILLLSFIGLTLLWSVIFFSIFFSQQPALDRRVESSAVSITSLRPPASLTPAAVTASSVSLVHRDATHVDLLAFLTNPNSVWGVSRLRYHFTLGDRALDGQEVFLNPSSERPIVQLNVAATSATTAGITIDDIDWVRSGTAAVSSARFTTDRLEINPASVKIGSQTILTITLKAEVTNRSVYNFLRVRVPIVVKTGSTVVAVDDQTLDRWPSLTSRTITSSWSYPISQADEAVLVPQVNQFDSSNLYQ